MLISDQTVVLFLLIGVIIGMIYTITRAIIAIFSIKKLGVFIFDFTFAAIVCMVTFTGALVVTGGPLRLLPLVLEVIGALCVHYAVSGAVLFLIGSLRKCFLSIKTNMMRQICALTRKSSKENRKITAKHIFFTKKQ